MPELSLSTHVSSRLEAAESDPPSIHHHQPHQSSAGFICCGQDYINSSTSLCCVSHDGKPTTNPAGNATVTLRCCGSKVIRQEEECCNGIGYNPERHVCADQPTPGLPVQVWAPRHKSSLNSEWCVNLLCWPVPSWDPSLHTETHFISFLQYSHICWELELSYIIIWCLHVSIRHTHAYSRDTLSAH